ncbi:hypothetical protein L208DRAFT_1462786 [Tricholoma matsutake]|nr:hypothetical protein L208DRAFT_1462786 [Tricholoma matsutake 945]
MYSQQKKVRRKSNIWKKMPRKTCANRARAENLHKGQKLVTNTTVEEVEDHDSIHLLLHAHPIGPEASSCQCNDITSDLELLDIIGALRGAAMIDDKDDISESGSEDDGDEQSDEIQEITTLEHFTSTLQRAHNITVTAEREKERGRKRPKVYDRNLDRTKRWYRQQGCELAAKGFRSMKDWLHQMLSASRETTACGTPDPDLLNLHEESEESSASEGEIQPISMEGLMKSAAWDKSEADSNCESQSGTMVGSDMPTTSEGRKAALQGCCGPDVERLAGWENSS